MEIALAILSGIAIGSVLGYIGAGGSMLAVPAFIYIFGFTPVQATTASLIVVFVGAASGALPKLRKNEILVKEALVIWAIGLSTNFTGAYFLPQIPEQLVLTGFALVLVVAGTSMLIPTPKESSERKVSPLALIVISLIIGAITGLFGIGGGFLAIPILILFYNVAPAKAAGTSLFIITINTLTGFFAHLVNSNHYGANGTSCFTVGIPPWLKDPPNHSKARVCHLCICRCPFHSYRYMVHLLS